LLGRGLARRGTPVPAEGVTEGLVGAWLGVGGVPVGILVGLAVFFAQTSEVSDIVPEGETPEVLVPVMASTSA